MKFMEKAKRFFTLSAKHEGFTLVELIVVIAILAILAGVAVPAYSGYIKRAEKAADLNLLAAVNDAFAAACMTEGKHPTEISSATLAWDGNKVVGISSVNGADKDAINAAFVMFYGGNEGTEFKTLGQKLYFANGVFGEGDGVLTNVFNSIIGNKEYEDSIIAVQGSAFATIGAEALLGQVVDVSSMAADMIGAGQGKIYDVVTSDAYMNTLADTMGITRDELNAKLADMGENDPAGLVTLLGNSTIMNVANTMNNMTEAQETALKNDLEKMNFAGLSQTLNDDPETGLSQAAMLYGMYTAYNPEAAKNMTETGDVSALINLKNDEGFMAYISQINNADSQAAKDYEGYKSALNIVNGAVNESPDAANQILNNGYDNADLQNMLQQIMGN